jgi:RNA polymerase sigma-70 factor (ECF subfamily)
VTPSAYQAERDSSSREGRGGWHPRVSPLRLSPAPEAQDSAGSCPLARDPPAQAITSLDPSKTVTLPPDEELIRRLRESDESALEVLVSGFWQRLSRFAEGILDQEGGAEDVVQEAFIRLWARRRELRFHGSFRALLYTLTRNAAIDERRRSGRRRALAMQADPPATQPSPLARAEASELRSVAEAAVAALPPRRRQVFRLAREEGLSYREIAEVMGLSLQTVANQMSRALTELHEELDGVFRNGSTLVAGMGFAEPEGDGIGSGSVVSEPGQDRVSDGGEVEE